MFCNTKSKLPISIPIQSITLALSDTLPPLQMLTKIHLDLIESSVKAHGCLQVVRIIICEC